MDRAGRLAMVESYGLTRYPDLTSTNAQGALSQLNHSESALSCVTTILFLNDGPDPQYDHVTAIQNVAPTTSKRFFVERTAAEPGTMCAGIELIMDPSPRRALWKSSVSAITTLQKSARPLCDILRTILLHLH